MNDRIELTEDETYAAAKAIFPDVVWADDRESYSATCKVVAKVVEAVNRTRFTDPVGTIRKPSLHSGIAVRVDNRKVKDWHIVHVNGDTRLESFSYVSSWPVIYSPDGAA